MFDDVDVLEILTPFTVTEDIVKKLIKVKDNHTVRTIRFVFIMMIYL